MAMAGLISKVVESSAYDVKVHLDRHRLNALGLNYRTSYVFSFLIVSFHDFISLAGFTISIVANCLHHF